MVAVRNREGEVDTARLQPEQLVKKEVDERIQWVLASESKLKVEEIMLEKQQGTATTKMAKGLLIHLIWFPFFLLTRSKLTCRPEGEKPS